MKKRNPVLFLSTMLLLASCGSQPSNNNNYSQPINNDPPQPSNNGGGNSQPAKSDKQIFIDYLQTYGTYSSGAYSISAMSTIDGADVLDYIEYDPAEDKFSTDVMIKIYSSYGTVTNFAMASFSWGSFTKGLFGGITTYETSSQTLKNSFRFGLNFSSYPNFEVATYESLSTGYAKSVSDDAQMDAACLTRAINNLINSMPSMGVNAPLW